MIQGVTHAHLGPIWYSDASDASDQFLGSDFFLPLLQARRLQDLVASYTTKNHTSVQVSLGPLFSTKFLQTTSELQVNNVKRIFIPKAADFAFNSIHFNFLFYFHPFLRIPLVKFFGLFSPFCPVFFVFSFFFNQLSQGITW